MDKVRRHKIFGNSQKSASLSERFTPISKFCTQMLIGASKNITKPYLPQSSVLCIQCLAKRQNSYSARKKRCYYDVLGVTQQADRKEIRSSYMSKTKELHPDINIDDPALHDQFVELNEAYSVLGDETKRVEYDELKKKLPRVAYNVNSRSPYSPFGSARSGYAEETHFNPKFQAFDENNPYAQNMYREFQFAKERYRGEKNSRNKYIIVMALAIMFGATGFHSIHLMYSRSRWKEYEDEVFQRNLSTYESVREKARLNGTRKQLQLLASNSNVSNTRSGKL